MRKLVVKEWMSLDGVFDAETIVFGKIKQAQVEP
jgi:hypothetical protein